MPPSRFRRALKGIGAGVGLLAVFTISAGGAAVLHIGTPVGRRVVHKIANDILGSTFEGSIVLGDIDRISVIDGIDLRGVSVLDAQGQPLLQLTGVRARVSAIAIAQNALFGKEAIRIRLPLIQVGDASALIEQTPKGTLNLAEAFTPRPPKTPPKKPAEPEPKGRDLIVELERIELTHAWVHGAIAPPRAVDAEVKGVVGAFRMAPEGMSLDIQDTGLVERAILPVQTMGMVSFHMRTTEPQNVSPDAPDAPLTDPSSPKSVSKLWADFAGRVGKLDVVTTFLLDGDRLEVSADAPSVTPEGLAQVVPDVQIPLKRSLSAKAHVAGDLPKLQAEATVLVNDSEGEPAVVGVDADIFAGDTVRIGARAAVDRIDPRTFGEDLPAASVSAFADADLEIGDKPRGVVFVHTEPLEVQGQPVPPLDAHAALDGELVTGGLYADEPGMPLNGSFATIPGGVTFEASTRVRSIRAVPRLSAPIDGAATVAVSGKVVGDALDARVKGSVSGLRAPGDVEVGAAQINGRVHGPFKSLNVAASVEGRELRAGTYDFERFSVAASGPVTAPTVRSTFHSNSKDFISVSGTVDAAAQGARGIGIVVEKDGQKLEARVRRVSAAGGRVSIEDLSAHGDAIQELGGSLVVRDGDITGKLRAENVDIERVVKLSGQLVPVRGIASIDLDLQKTRNGHKGHVNLSLEGGEYAVVHGLSSAISVAFNEQKVTANGFVRVVPKTTTEENGASCCGGEIAAVRFSGEGDELRGSLLAPETWTKLAGSVNVAAEDMDLGCLADLVPGALSALPLSELAGKLTARATVSRAHGQGLPSISDLRIRTRGLKVAGPRKFGEDEPEWASRSIDLNIEGSYDPETGTTNAGVAIFDQDLLLDLRATADVDVPALMKDPAHALQRLRTTPVAGHLTIPRREVQSFSTVPFVKAGSLPVAGDVRVDAYFAGNANKPALAMRAMAWGVTSRAGGPKDAPFKLPLDVDTLLVYDAEKATFAAHVSADRRELVTVNAEVAAKLADLISGKAMDPKNHLWTGSLEAKLHDAPLGEVPYLARNNVGGHMSGSIALKGLNDKPKVAIDLDVPDLQLGPHLFFETARVSVHIDPDQQAAIEAAKEGAGSDMPAPPRRFASANTGVAKVELAAQDGGTLSLVGYSGIVWKDGLIPTPDENSPANVNLATRRFRIEAAQPFVAPVLTRLDGYLDGDLRVGWRQMSDETNARIKSDLALTGGVVHAPSIGQELHDVHFRLLATPTGVIRLDDIGAKGIAGDVTGWALARLKKLALESAAAEITIGAHEALPVAVDGVPFGGVTGKVMLTASMKDKTLTAGIRVPELHVELPASIGRSVQSLDENPEITVKQPLGLPEEPPAAPDGSKVVLNLEIGNAAIDSDMFKVGLGTSKTAPIRVELTDKARVSGDIVVQRGELEVLGKRFELDRGLVHMTGQDDPNPYVNATVRWEAPDGTVIYIDYVGTINPITDEKIHFRSEPSKSKQEIIATLLLGSEYEHGTVAGGGGAAQQAGPKQSTTSAAGGLAAGFVSAQFSKLFADAGFKTSLGTTDSGALKTGLAYEKGSTRTAITYEGAGSSTGTHSATGGHTGASTEVSLDWRFHRNWLVRGMVRVGEDQPSSGVDVLWQYRY